MKAQLIMLKGVQREYDGHTIGNIIQQIEQRIKFYEQQNEIV